MDAAPGGSLRWESLSHRAPTIPHAVPIGAVLLAMAAVIEATARTVGPGVRPLFVLLVALLALCSTLPLAMLAATGSAVLIVGSAVVSMVPFGTLTVASVVALLCAMYRLGRRGSRLPAGALIVLLLVPAVLAIGVGLANRETDVIAVLVAALAPSACWVGTLHRSGRQTRQYSADRDAVLDTLLEHGVRGERARIARELHDVVAHHISMIAVQAETARLTVPQLPAAGAQRLSAIGDTARSALTEMRRLLGVLREDVGTDAPLRQPQPGLRQLNELLDETRAASGSGARLIVDGRPDPLDPVVELAAFRIVQEALTNARRHAPGAAVDVELHYRDDELRLRIRDNGPGPGAAVGGAPQQVGLGLAGMRERAAAVGGRLRTGPATGGGFLIEARLPARAERL
ncbi:sensor histidine kinase [Nakamurella lactea]|uniref:sensor histidine kinase n=1 Tax=Nakamurella lactea TaxID=459515 RepID=UPI001B7FCCBF|nr:sensor histidine kinase [Nakamurella lactea]